MKENALKEKSYAFAIRIVKLFQYLTVDKREFVLSKQLIRCGTSIGANIAEANGAISKAEFSAKISISYKESLESKYWLELLFEIGYLSQYEFQSIYKDNDELSKLLYSVLKSTDRIKNLESKN